MKTITPIALRRLMDVSGIELIDVRRQDDFRKVHAFGARSVPLRRFEPHSVLAHRKLDRGAPLYLMCDRSMLASAAAGSLSGAGFDKSIVVQGGLEAWLEQDMPMAGARVWRRSTVAVLKKAALRYWLSMLMRLRTLGSAVGARLRLLSTLRICSPAQNAGFVFATRFLTTHR